MGESVTESSGQLVEYQVPSSRIGDNIETYPGLCQIDFMSLSLPIPARLNAYILVVFQSS